MHLGMKKNATNDTSCMGLWSSLTIINRDCQIFSSLDLPFSILKKSQSDPNQFYALTESIEWIESIHIDDTVRLRDGDSYSVQVIVASSSPRTRLYKYLRSILTMLKWMSF